MRHREATRLKKGDKIWTMPIMGEYTSVVEVDRIDTEIHKKSGFISIRYITPARELDWATHDCFSLKKPARIKPLTDSDFRHYEKEKSR